MNKISSRRHPTFAVQMIALFLSVLTVLCFFLPFTNLRANPNKIIGWLDLFFNKGDGKGENISGFEVILMPFSGETIHDNLDIGPLPTNLYLLCALLCALLAIAVYFIKKLAVARFLIASLLNLCSTVCLILFPIRFAAYYGKYTKNGALAFTIHLQSDTLLLTILGGLIICAILMFFAFMTNLLLYSQLKYDPLCRKL